MAKTVEVTSVQVSAAQEFARRAEERNERIPTDIAMIAEARPPGDSRLQRG